LLNNPATIQLIERNQTNETNQQPTISKYVIVEKTLEEILRDINKQILETKYTLNLGQLLRAIPNIKITFLTWYHQNLLYQNQQLHQLPLIIKWQ
jgi:hypothetical protein